MANQPLLVREILGILPALESKNIGKPFVVDGRDFMLDFEGPYSAFSSLYASYAHLANASQVGDFRVEDDRFFFTNSGIFKYDPTSMLFQPLYTFTEVTSYWPWSVAEIGGIWYFCRKDVAGTGIIKYDPSTITFTPLVASELPADPRSICASYGRLIVLGSSRVAWSNLDNGTVFTSSLATGTGSQGTSAYAPGIPLRVAEVADGFLYFSDQAIGKAEIIEIETTFRHYNLSHMHKLVNPFALATVNDLTHVFLTKQGFVVTDGAKPKAYQELFSQHLIRHVFPNLDSLTEQPSLRLYYAEDQDWLMLSIASRDNPTTYGMAYGLNIVRDQWGRFDKPHYGFGQFNLDPTDPNAKFNLGYIDLDGFLHKFLELPYSENSFDSLSNLIYHAYSNFPSTFSGGIWNPKTLIKMSSIPEGLLRNSVSGLYFAGNAAVGPEPALPLVVDETIYSVTENYSWEDWLISVAPDEDWLTSSDPAEDWLTGDPGAIFPCLAGMTDGWSYFTVQNVPIVPGPIGAYIEIGQLRLPVAENPDEMSLITELSIGMFDNTTFGGTEDWMTMPNETADWMLLAGMEDWGFGIPSLVSYSVEMIATNDGLNTFTNQVPTMSTDAGAVQFYKPFITGIFHKVRVGADEVDQAFHLKFLELSGSNAGRL